MPATVQLNTRIDPELKRRGDAVFARAGLTPSEVVRAVWQEAADTQRVPECVMRTREEDPERARRRQAIQEGAECVRAHMKSLGIRPSYTPLDYEQLRDEMYDAMIERMEARHV
jgi:RHH-type rel operon transcriptional repressor/antitoxin RelB